MRTRRFQFGGHGLRQNLESELEALGYRRGRSALVRGGLLYREEVTALKDAVEYRLIQLRFVSILLVVAPALALLLAVSTVARQMVRWLGWSHGLLTALVFLFVAFVLYIPVTWFYGALGRRGAQREQQTMDRIARASGSKGTKV
ncbi:MAG: hypothetical protein AAFX94_04775 [Myxococcota bacterium]